jgi:hypothetical protein
MYKFNITVQELRAALAYAEENDLKYKNVITMELSRASGLGTVIKVSAEWNGKQEDITDYGSW